MTETLTAETDLRALATAVGGGFHPDTRGEDYTTLPEGWTPERVDAVVEAAFDADLDVYGIAVDVLTGAPR